MLMKYGREENNILGTWEARAKPSAIASRKIKSKQKITMFWNVVGNYIALTGLCEAQSKVDQLDLGRKFNDFTVKANCNVHRTLPVASHAMRRIFY